MNTAQATTAKSIINSHARPYLSTDGYTTAVSAKSEMIGNKALLTVYIDSEYSFCCECYQMVIGPRGGVRKSKRVY